MKKVFAFLLVVIIIAVAAVVYQAASFLSERPSSTPEAVRFAIQPGETFGAVAQRLEQSGLITDAFKFRVLARATGGGKVRVGEYAIPQNALPKEVLKIVNSGRSLEYSITFQEGINIYEMAAALDRQGLLSGKEFLVLCKNPQFLQELLGEALESCEGYMFPETYSLTKFTTVRTLMKIMAANFLQNYKSIPPNGALGLNRHQIVTLASIIEKETGAVDERQLVSSVFHNRIKLGMKLQTDPTIVYGILDSGRPYAGNIRKSDLLAPTRYNTYVIKGLPPGPIANPGKLSLHAAMYPARSDYLFFVSKNDGTHVFSADYGNHRKAVGQFQLDAKAREGRSWRELSKKQVTPNVQPAPQKRAQ